jgi:hypothetical protein
MEMASSDGVCLPKEKRYDAIVHDGKRLKPIASPRNYVLCSAQYWRVEQNNNNNTNTK